MSQDIKNLMMQLQEYYQSSGRNPEGLYDLLLSFIFWEAVSEQEQEREHEQTRKLRLLYNEVMKTPITPKEMMRALTSWKDYSAYLPKELLLPDKDSIDHLPKAEWQQICTVWITNIEYKKRLGENYLEAILDYLEMLVANSRNDDGYLTPRAVTHTMVKYLEGGNGSSLYDPYPRSGNLLAAAAQINAVTNLKSGPTPDRLTHKLMAIRLLLFRNNLLTLPHNSHKLTTTTQERFDYILSNPPFGTGVIDHILPQTNGVWTEIAKKSRRLDVAFLCHILSNLSVNGRAAVVVPVIYLSSSNTVVGRLVKEIVDQNLLDAVIKLPGDLFATTKVATAVLCFSKTRKQNQKVHFINASKAIDKKGKQISLDEDQLNNWISQMKSGTTDDTIGKASAQCIAQSDYILHPEQYQSPAKTATETLQTADELWQKCTLLQLELVQVHNHIQQFLKPR